MVANWMRFAHPGTLFYAVPNGGLRDKRTAAKLKAAGVAPGVPDLAFPVARGGYHGLYVEMKRSKGGRVTSLQREWIAKLRANGYKAEVCSGADAAMAVIERYLREE